MSISQSDIQQAQARWANKLIEVGKYKDDPEKCQKVAEDLVDELYGYDIEDVLFKPTRASDHPFRFTKEAALSYFIGGNIDYSEDLGFALNPWIDIKFSNRAVNIQGDIAMAMGDYVFTTPDGIETRVEYSFVYKKQENGDLKIILHHSSFPFVTT